MNTKLTLRMDESLIAAAKDYAAAHGSSLSQMVANYFAALGQKADRASGVKTSAASQATTPDDWRNDLGPVTRSLIGILKAAPNQTPVSEDDYHAYLERKYLADDSASQPGSPS